MRRPNKRASKRVSNSARSASRAAQIILGDIGGTTARFAVLSEGHLGPIAHMGDAAFPTFIDALRHFLRQQTARDIRAMLLAVAGPIDGDHCALVNNRWIIDGAELRSLFGFSDVRLVNDFEAVAWSLPQLATSDVLCIGDGKPVPHAPMAVIGPGTGLGVAGFIPDSGHPRVVATEGGHGTLPASSPREDAVIHILRKRFGHVSCERALSGTGIENLYHALSELDHAPVPERTAAEIAKAAVDGSCAISRAALDMFCAMLGTVAGNLALNFGARGGIYIAGGIAPRMADFLARSPFRQRFEAKGRLSGYMRSIPTYLIVHPDVAFHGLQMLARQR